MKRYMCIGKKNHWEKTGWVSKASMLQKRESAPDKRRQEVSSHCGSLTKGELSAWFFLWAQQGIRRVTETLERYMRSEHRGNPGFLSCIEPREVRRTQSGNGYTGHPGGKAWGSPQRFHRAWQGVGVEDSIPVLRGKHESDKGLRWSCYVSWSPVGCGCHGMI